MNKQAGAEWGQVKAKLEKYRAEHFRAGMLKAAAIIESFPCRFDPYGKAKMLRAAQTIRREADRRGKA